jgi:hypothetical protein
MSRHTRSRCCSICWSICNRQELARCSTHGVQMHSLCTPYNFIISLDCGGSRYQITQIRTGHSPVRLVLHLYTPELPPPNLRTCSVAAHISAYQRALSVTSPNKQGPPVRSQPLKFQQFLCSNTTEERPSPQCRHAQETTHYML